MKWKTSISQHKEGDLYIRGYKLTDLIASHGFVDGIFLVVRGKLPTPAESDMLSACLLACVDHGVQVPSAFVGRVVASTGNSVNAALAADMLAIGQYHGGAIEGAMDLFLGTGEAKEIVANTLLKKERLAGFGHKVYKESDPRTAALFARAYQEKFPDQVIKKALLFEKELALQSGKVLPLNIDGAIAAILVTMGFSPKLGRAFFALGRMPGMIAHIIEELENERPYRRFEQEDVEYQELKK